MFTGAQIVAAGVTNRQKIAAQALGVHARRIADE
jgi:hypothetical protein